MNQVATIALALASSQALAQQSSPSQASANVAERHALERYQRIIELDEGESGINAVIALNHEIGREARAAFDANTPLGGRCIRKGANSQTARALVQAMAASGPIIRRLAS